jgi:hypothetical protein
MCGVAPESTGETEEEKPRSTEPTHSESHAMEWVEVELAQSLGKSVDDIFSKDVVIPHNVAKTHRLNKTSNATPSEVQTKQNGSNGSGMKSACRYVLKTPEA